MFVVAIIAWGLAAFVLAYDAAGNMVARRSGPLSYRAAVSMLSSWKLGVSALAPWVGYVALFVAAYFAFGFVGLLAFGVVWGALYWCAAQVWARGVLQGTIDIDDFVPTRWVQLTVGFVLAVVSVVCAWAAL